VAAAFGVESYYSYYNAESYYSYYNEIIQSCGKVQKAELINKLAGVP
jgi:hypothetical protein